MNDHDDIIVVQDLHKHFGSVRALNGVSLSVERGRVVVIIGPSGSGKSTLLRCVNHLEIPSSGEVWIDGKQLTTNQKQLNRVRAEIGMVFQLFNLFPHLTALENVTLAQKVVRDRSKEEAEKVAMKQLERVGIPEKADAYPGQLSGGQQQRVAIARALANDPKVILADEPTGNLDSQTAGGIMDLFTQLKSHGKTLFIVTHDDEIAGRADRVLHIDSGALKAASSGLNHSFTGTAALEAGSWR